MFFTESFVRLPMCPYILSLKKWRGSMSALKYVIQVLNNYIVHWKLCSCVSVDGRSMKSRH